MSRNSARLQPPARAHGPFRDTVVVIMAGGAGTRFWPLSTPDLPKQFLTAFSDKPLYVQAADRARALVPWNRILVMTHARFAGLVRAQTPDVPRANVILEPERRNTAPAIILAAVIINRRWPGSVMVVMPSDHLIADPEAFRRTLSRAVARARRGGLGTIGVPPAFPSTEFGYLRLAGPYSPGKAVPIEQFVEKPGRARAKRFLASGRFLWNSGIFVWRTDVLLKAAAAHLPQVCRPISALAPAVGTPTFTRRCRAVFARVPSISVDYGIMEKADDVWAIPAEFSWSDVGNWLGAADLAPADALGNRVRGNVVLDAARRNLVISAAAAPVLVAGIRDCVVVHGPAGTLVCHKSRVHGLRRLVERILPHRP